MTTYDDLFSEIFTMTSDDDFLTAQHHLLDCQLITEEQFQELWDILCDVHQRYIA